MKGLKLAQELGAETTVLGAAIWPPPCWPMPAAAMFPSWWWANHRPAAAPHHATALLEQLTRHAHDVDVYVVSHELGDETPPGPMASTACCLAKPAEKQGMAIWPPSGLPADHRPGQLLTPFFDLSNVVMLYLLAVVLVAVRFGRGPGCWHPCWR
jgi:two-component system sensor histidine kinase KdpD